MRFYVLSNDADTRLGLRLAGMEGERVENEGELRETLQRLQQDPDIGVIVISEGLVSLAPHVITEWRLKFHLPLIVEIPDRTNSNAISTNIAQYIANAIGIRV